MTTQPTQEYRVAELAEAAGVGRSLRLLQRTAARGRHRVRRHRDPAPLDTRAELGTGGSLRPDGLRLRPGIPDPPARPGAGGSLSRTVDQLADALTRLRPPVRLVADELLARAMDRRIHADLPEVSQQLSQATGAELPPDGTRP